ncbi:MAG: hypothetical protein JEZ11_04020 [Desulfobacterales bacterium]|nr:hypothetical protein [Desulfobacterales bacterium]
MSIAWTWIIWAAAGMVLYSMGPGPWWTISGIVAMGMAAYSLCRPGVVKKPAATRPDLMVKATYKINDIDSPILRTFFVPASVTDGTKTDEEAAMEIGRFCHSQFIQEIDYKYDVFEERKDSDAGE